MYRAFKISRDVMPLQNNSKLVCPPVCSPESTCSNLKVSAPLSPTTTQNLTQTQYSLIDGQFCWTLKLQTEQHTFTMNKTLLITHIRYSIMTGRTQPNRLCSIHICCHNFVLVAVVPSQGQSRNYFMTLCILTQTIQMCLHINYYIGIQTFEDIILSCYIRDIWFSTSITILQNVSKHKPWHSVTT